MDGILPFSIKLEDIAAALAGLAAFASVMVAWLALVEPRPRRLRLQRLEAHHVQTRSPLRERLGDPYRQRGFTLMRRVVARFNLLRSEQAARIGVKLAQAGWRSRDAMVAFLFFKLCFPAIFGAIAVVLLYGVGVLDLPPIVQLLIALLAVVAGFFGPDLVVSNTAVRRRERM